MSSKEIKIIEARINEELDNIDSLTEELSDKNLIISGHNEIFNNRQLIIIIPCLFKIAM